jgi:hypothetical protein
LLAALCCFALVLVVPVPSSAQLGGVVQGTKHGIEKGVDKTKEGAEAVGHGTKKLFTDDSSQDKDQKQYQKQTNTRMKPAQTQPSTSSTETQTQRNRTTTMGSGQKQSKRMPRTAGELPLLALAGCLSLAIAGAYRLADRSRRSHDEQA